VIDIDQSPNRQDAAFKSRHLHRRGSSDRDLFAQLPESRMRGYKPGRYSFNVKGGRCEACEGDGLIKIEMHFLPDGVRDLRRVPWEPYNRETLDIVTREKHRRGARHDR